ncbi:MAG: hypothetical protein K2X77_04385 [Candidatus Obscuribacterales bacterium]|jgi:hypothetical protein|nr:hypothetical protein [Candidatus Obscuribacterales bacterium]
MKIVPFVSLFLAFTFSLCASAEDEKHVLSVVPMGVKPASSVAKPANAVTPVNKVDSSAAKPAANPAGNGTTSSSSELSPGDAPGTEGTAVVAPTVKSYYSAALDQAVRQYKSAPSDGTYGAVINALKTVLASPGGARLSPAILGKDNPYLSDFKPRVVDSGAVRLWSFPKAPERAHILLQWFDSHQQIVGAGRHKRVVTTTALRFQDFQLPSQINVKDAGIVSSKDAGKSLVLAGDNEDGSLWVSAYKLTEAGWQANPAFLSTLPAFLQNNVSGRLGFRGNDLVFNVGKMLLTTDSNGVKRWLPEAESANYRFLVKQTESGYVLHPSVPNEEAFVTVHDFMRALQQSRGDIMKSLLVDPHLASIPRYLGLQGKSLDSSARVVEMSLPPARGQRFRLINIGKDDLIFDVAKVKGVPQIKAIFVAQPDPFLQEIGKNFPLYSHFDQVASEKKEADAAAASAAAAGTPPKAIKRK